MDAPFDIFSLILQWVFLFCFFQMSIRQKTNNLTLKTETCYCLYFAVPVGVRLEAGDVHRNIIASQSKHPLEFLMKSEKEAATGPLYSCV